MFFTGRLRRRCRQPELMDQPGLSAAEHEQALRGLERINRWNGSARIPRTTSPPAAGVRLPPP